jgi:hypothetical protein
MLSNFHASPHLTGLIAASVPLRSRLSRANQRGVQRFVKAGLREGLALDN